MKFGTTLFRTALVIGWAALFYVSVRAVQVGGVGNAGAEFLRGFSQPWPAQFNTDFTLFLLLTAAWIFWRSKTWWVGLIFAVLSINLGGIFTLAYLLVASIQAEGDMRKVLLGARA